MSCGCLILFPSCCGVWVHTQYCLLCICVIVPVFVTIFVWHATSAVEAEDSEEEEVITEEYTEIVETFQTSDDGGKTWKRFRKTTRITPEGTSENIEVISGSLCCMHTGHS